MLSVSKRRQKQRPVFFWRIVPRKNLKKGEVIAVGAAKEGKSVQVQPGQTVLFKKYGPVEVDVDGAELLILEEEEILAIFV